MARIVVELGTLTGVKTTPNAIAQQALDWYFEATAPKLDAQGNPITYTNQQKMDWIAFSLAKHIERTAKGYRREQNQAASNTQTDLELEPIQM